MLVFIQWSLLVVAGASIYLWWQLPRWQTRKLPPEFSPKETVIQENQFRMTVSTALAGWLILLSALAAVAQLKQGAIDKEIEADNQMLARGFELLGKSSLAEHAGGINLLQIWADKQDHRVRDLREKILIDTFVGFIRQQATADQGSSIGRNSKGCPEYNKQTESPTLNNTPPDHSTSRMIKYDVQAALDYLVKASRRTGGKPLEVYLSWLSLPKARLDGGNFSGSSFDFTDLYEATLTGAIFNNVNFHCASLYGADLTGVQMSTVKSGRQQMNLTNAMLNKAKMDRANLSGAKLDHAELKEADLSNTDLSHASMFKANLSHATVNNLKVNKDTDVRDACLLGIDRTVFRKAKNWKEGNHLDSEGCDLRQTDE